MSAKLFLFFAFVVSMLLMSVSYRKKKKRIVFFGDSITEQGAKWGGYIKVLQKLLQEEDFDESEKYELLPAGISGNKVTDLYNRVEKDVLYNGTDIVVIFIGINDIWHKDKRGDGGTEVTEFERVYEEIIHKLQSAQIKIVLCTPTVIGEKNNYLNAHDEDLETYSHIVRKLAHKHELPLVDLRQAFLAYNRQHNIEDLEQGILTSDTVHLNAQGNQLVAEEIWKVLQTVMQ